MNDHPDLYGLAIFALGLLVGLPLCLWLIFRPWTGTPPVVVDPDAWTRPGPNDEAS